MRKLSTAVKKKISTLNDVAHERELGAALAELERDFAQWREGKFDALELNQRVHAFHDGKSRELHKQYTLGQPRLNVASALQRKVLTEEEAGAEVLEQLAHELAFYRGLGAENP